MYDTEVEEEFESLKKNYEDGELKGIQKFMEDWAYEDEYSHNQIEEMQAEFKGKAKEYLDTVSPGKYTISGGWAVFVKEII